MGKSDNIELKFEHKKSKDLFGCVYYPVFGSGGMFVMSKKLFTEHQGNDNNSQIQSLGEYRDALLSKLMSGEFRVF